MPRTPTQTRRPTEEDLTSTQREIYAALPTELRASYLNELPPIRVPAVQRRRKLERIQRQLGLLDEIIPALQSHREQLARAAKDLESGADPRSVDLRQLLRAPKLTGASLRYLRSPKG